MSGLLGYGKLLLIGGLPYYIKVRIYFEIIHMALTKPYQKIFRYGPANTLGPFYDDMASEIGIGNIASYELLKKDLKKVFEFVEPCEQNNATFSHRNFEILLRACTEVEALCKQVFVANGHNLSGLNILRYSDLETAMQLSNYEVKSYGFFYPNFMPFKSFNSTVRENRSPEWYKAYNDVKHNRINNFQKASLKNIIEAVGGVYVLLVAMYGLGFDHVLRYSWQYHQHVDVPTFFRTEYPSWEEADKYDYDWEVLKGKTDKFQNHPLEKIA